MLDDLLKRQDVLHFIDVLKKSNMFHLRNQLTYSYHNISMSYELGLYLFYDAWHVATGDQRICYSVPNSLQGYGRVCRHICCQQRYNAGVVVTN